MKLSVICRFLFLCLMTVLFATLVKPMPAYAMACCSDLNCEGNYKTCIEDCAANNNTLDCMNGCLYSARACARTLCDDCGPAMPCWFDSVDCNIAYGPGGQCGLTSDCPSGYMCNNGHCENGTPGTCSYDRGCAYPYVCLETMESGAICVIGGCAATAAVINHSPCETNSNCGPGAYCVAGFCQSCPDYPNQSCSNGLCAYH